MNPIAAEIQLYVYGIYVVLSILLIVLFWDFLYVAKRKNSTHKAKRYFPKVSVIIPAHNESLVLPKTLKTIFSSKYPKNNLEVIVVDDGSTDNTASVAKKFGANLIKNKVNLGKCASLNIGIKNASSEIVVTTDADTKFEKNTIENLAKHFADEEVGAVAGYYKSFPFRELFSSFSFSKLKEFFLVKFQNLEYLTFLFARKRQAALDAVMVVPGSIGAFRKDVLEKIGGFDTKMLIEDYDATLKIHRAGYKIVCEKEALAWTKPPLSLSELFRQRVRWYRGGFEVLAKNSDFLKSRHGFVHLILAFEYLTIFLQLAMFSFIGASIYEKIILLHQNLFQILMTWLYGFINLKPLDIFGAVIVSLFLVGFAEAYAAVKMSKDSPKNLLYYPLSVIYLSFLGFVWFYSLFSHLTKRKVDMHAHAWKATGV